MKPQIQESLHKLCSLPCALTIDGNPDEIYEGTFLMAQTYANGFKLAIQRRSGKWGNQVNKPCAMACEDMFHFPLQTVLKFSYSVISERLEIVISEF